MTETIWLSSPLDDDEKVVQSYWTTAPAAVQLNAAAEGAHPTQDLAGGIPRCIPCLRRHSKCEMMGFVCLECCQSGELCFRLLFSDEPVFKKWQNAQYQASLNQWAGLVWQGNAFSLKVYHFAAGPSLKVKCRKFSPDNDDQTTVWAKSKTGWRAEETHALGLDPGWRPQAKALREYVSKCVQHCLAEADRNGLLTAIALHPSEHSALLHGALRLWAANRLLVKGWQAAVGFPVATPDSPLVNTVPAPRVLQHQLDRILELYICQLERQLLPMLQTAMVARVATQRMDAFFATLVLLNTLERDTWRLTYWTKHVAESYKWSHPERAGTLIDRNVFVANLLLWEMSSCLGDVKGAFQTLLQGSHGEAISYEELDEGSLDGMFTKSVLNDLGFSTNDFHLHTV